MVKLKTLNKVKELAIKVVKYIYEQILRLYNTYKEHKFLYTILTTIFFFFLYILIRLIIINIKLPFISIVNEYNSNNALISQHIFIKGILLENLSFLISFLLLPIAGIWALHQFTKNRKSSQQSNGAKISERFSSDLINRMSVIDHMLKEFDGRENILEKLNKFDKLNFNIYEMEKIFTKKEIDNFSNYISSKKTNKEYLKYLKANYTQTERQRFPKKFMFLILDTLNNLESICMNISSTAAGSEFIYPSLHSVFLNLIQSLYIIISEKNRNNIDICFINVIYVYNSWNKIKLKDYKIFIATQKKIDKKNEKAKKEQLKLEKEIQKLLDKKPKTV